MNDLLEVGIAIFMLILIPIAYLVISWAGVCFFLWLLTLVLGMHFFLDLASVIWLLLLILFLCIRAIMKINEELKD